MKKVAVILSGCGVYDGAEIHESVLTLLALDKADVGYQCLAPDIELTHVIDHSKGEVVEESRNVLKEAARIARGAILALGEAKLEDFDAVVLPGGFGAAKNLCNFAFDAAHLEVLPELAEFLKKAHEMGKPLGFACIAPAIAARVFGEKGLKFTIGDDAGTAQALEAFGGTHVAHTVTEVEVDSALKIATTPAYMFGDARISEVSIGIEKWVQAVLAL